MCLNKVWLSSVCSLQYSALEDYSLSLSLSSWLLLLNVDWPLATGNNSGLPLVLPILINTSVKLSYSISYSLLGQWHAFSSLNLPISQLVQSSSLLYLIQSASTHLAPRCLQLVAILHMPANCTEGRLLLCSAMPLQQAFKISLRP